MKLRILSLAAFGLAMAGCSKVTLENYNKLHVGMRYAEVQELLGKPTKCSDVLTVKTCTWGEPPRYVNVSFVADQVVVFHAENIR